MARRKLISVLSPADWFDRPHVLAAGIAARALYQAAQHYCALQMTDGMVTRAAMPLIAAKAGVDDPAAAAAALEEAGLWARTGDGWQDTEYLAHNWSRAEYEDYAEQKRENGRKGGRPRKHPPPENQDANQVGFPGAVGNQDGNQLGSQDGNQLGSQDANQDGTKPRTKSEPSIRLRDRDRDPHPGHSQLGSDPPANADRAREGAGARDAPKVVRLREGTPPSKAFLRRTFEAFRASYPKSVPDDPAMKSLWAEHCRDDDSFKAIMDGLAAWKESRRWKKDGNDFVRKPRTFLEEQEYLSPPLPWSGDGAPPDPAGNGKEGTDAEHRGDRGRAAGAAAAAERVYAGDIHDPYWREHGGQLLNQPRRRAAT